MNIEDLEGYVCNQCAYKWCINPEHLRTRREKVKKEPGKRGNHGMCFDEQNGKSKLTEKKVLRIRANKGVITQIGIS